jgi:hypothetical protein
MPTLFELDFLLSKYGGRCGDEAEPFEGAFSGFYLAIARIQYEMSSHLVELIESYRSSDDYYLATLAEAIHENRLDKIQSIMATLD